MSAARTLLKNGALRNMMKRSYHADPNFKSPSMNDLPLPGGSWKADHDAKNVRYNIHLLFGIAFTTVTLITAKASGLVYLNYYPPAKPAVE